MTWDINEDGAWCPACGFLVVAAHHHDSEGEELAEAARRIETCRQCGFPDFEDGHGYFTD